MINPTGLTERLLFNTVRLTVENTTGSIAVGTGFFFDFPLDDGRIATTIITNKHVLEGANKVQLMFHQAEGASNETIGVPSSQSFSCTLTNINPLWIPHPSPDVDLGALLIGGALQHYAQQDQKIFLQKISTNFIYSHNEMMELGAAEEVLMVGYPNGLWDTVNNLPILRRGITATHPAMDFEGKSVFMIDTACFPGSSGSPVFLWSEGGFLTKDNKAKLGRRIALLGVLYAGPQISATGEIIVCAIPTSPLAVVTPIMMHLGYVIKACEILALKELVIQRALQNP